MFCSACCAVSKHLQNIHGVNGNWLLDLQLKTECEFMSVSKFVLKCDCL